MKDFEPIGCSQLWQMKQPSCHVEPAYSNFLVPGREKERWMERKTDSSWDSTFLGRTHPSLSLAILIDLVVIILSYEITHFNCLKAYKTHFVSLRFTFILNQNITGRTLLSHCWKLAAGRTERDNAIFPSVSPTNPSSIPWLLSFLLHCLVYSTVTQWFVWGRHFALMFHCSGLCVLWCSQVRNYKKIPCENIPGYKLTGLTLAQGGRY